MIFNCPYCKKEITDVSQSLDNPERYRVRCYHDDVKITFIYHFGMSKDLLFTWFEVDGYLLVSSMIDNDCWLYTGPESSTGHFNYMLHLNYSPDVTPENVKKWIDRLRNIKAFS